MNESPQLESQDWRINSIVDAPPNSVQVDGKWNAEPILVGLATTGAYKGFGIGFSLPSGPALFLNLSYKSHLNAAAFLEKAITGARLMDGSMTESDLPASDVYDYLELVMASLVFAYTALESFANSVIPETYVYQAHEKYFTRSYNRDQIERGLHLDIKLGIILPESLSVSSPKGTRLWEDYKTLNGLRDRIIHLKAKDTSCQVPETNSVWGEFISDSLPKAYVIANAMIGHFLVEATRPLVGTQSVRFRM